MWGKIKLLFSELGDFMIEFLKSGSRITICEIGPFAFQAVLNVENSEINEGREKFNYAETELIKLFPKLELSDIHTAIQIAVILLKQKGLEKKSNSGNNVNI